MKTRHLSTVTLSTLFTFFIHLATAAPGDLDTTFGTGGKVTTAIGSGDDHGRSVALQPDGKVVVAGWSNNQSSNENVSLLRHEADGTVDTGFGTDGKVTTAIGSTFSSVHSVVLQPDVKIVVAGETNSGSDDDVALLRYTGNGTMPTTQTLVEPSLEPTGLHPLNPGRTDSPIRTP